MEIYQYFHMSSFTLNPLKMAYLQLDKLLTLGATKPTASENRSIKLINSLALLMAAMVLGIGLFFYFLIPTLSILIPVLTEALLLIGVAVLNAYNRQTAANMAMFLIHCASAIYWAGYLGPALPVNLVAAFLMVFLISGSFLIYKNKTQRLICLIATLVLISIVALNDYYHWVQPVSMSSKNNGLFQFFCTLGMIVLIAIIYISYVGENDLLIAEKEQATKQKTIYINEISHEIRTPMNAVYGIAQLLKREAKLNPDLKGITPLIDLLLTSSINARSIINGVLDMAEIEAGKIDKIEETAVRTTAYFQHIVDACKVLARSRGITISLDIQRMPEVIICDQVKVSQILTNLLANAIKYTTNKRMVNVSISAVGDQWYIKVVNMGTPIPPQKLKIIFDPFITAKDHHIEGTGLGLAIVKNKVTVLGGDIKVESLDTGITSFTAFLPLKAGATADIANDTAAEEIDLASISVFIAEDNEINTALLKGALKNMDCRVSTAANGVELLHLVEKEIPDIIILDMHMPVMSGDETLKYLRNAVEFRNIPVIIATADAFTENDSTLMQAGAAAIIRKPIDYRELQQIMHRVLIKGEIV